MTSARSPRAGAILFEVLLSLALFTGAAAFTLGAAGSVLESLDRSRRETLALDLARSKLAELEAGLVALADLRDGETVRGAGTVVFPGQDAGRAEMEWTVEITTVPTEFTGLTLVELTVTETGGTLDPPPRQTLRQLVALREGAAPEYREDDLLRGLPTGAPADAPPGAPSGAPTDEEEP